MALPQPGPTINVMPTIRPVQTGPVSYDQDAMLRAQAGGAQLAQGVADSITIRPHKAIAEIERAKADTRIAQREVDPDIDFKAAEGGVLNVENRIRKLEAQRARANLSGDPKAGEKLEKQLRDLGGQLAVAKSDLARESMKRELRGQQTEAQTAQFQIQAATDKFKLDNFDAFSQQQLAETEAQTAAARVKSFEQQAQLAAMNRNEAMVAATADETLMSNFLQAKALTEQLMQGGVPTKAVQEATMKVVEDLKINPLDEYGRAKTWARLSQDIVDYHSSVATEKLREFNKPVLTKLTENAETSRQIETNVDALRALIDDGITTGAFFGTDVGGFVNKVMSQLGIKEAQARQQFESLAMPMIGEIRKMFPGQVSNFEMQLYRAAVAGVQYPPEVNAKIISMMKDRVRQIQEKADFFTAFGDSVPHTKMEQMWTEYSKRNPYLYGKAGNSYSTKGGKTLAQGWEVHENSLRMDWRDWTETNPDAQKAIYNQKLAMAKQDPGKLFLGTKKPDGNFVHSDPSVPFVRDPETNAVKPNDAYWAYGYFSPNRNTPR
jgi:hypothetical protein